MGPPEKDVRLGDSRARREDVAMVGMKGVCQGHRDQSPTQWLLGFTIYQTALEGRRTIVGKLAD